MSTGRAGFGAALGFAAGFSVSELSVESEESASSDFGGAELALSAGVVADPGLESLGGVEAGVLVAGVSEPLAAGFDGALPPFEGAAPLGAGSGVMLGELEDAELEDPASLGAEFVALAVGLFEWESNQGIGCPFHRKYPNPAASKRAIKIRKTLPAPLPRGSSSSSRR